MEPKPNDLQYRTNAAPLPLAQREAIETGIQWIRDWYTARAQESAPDGKPYLSAEQLERMMNRLDHVRIYCGTAPTQALIKDLQEGTLHIKPQLEEQLTIDDVRQGYERIGQDHPYLGMHSTLIEEPHILLNTALMALIDQPTSGRDPQERYGQLTETTIHELTHLLEVDATDLNRIERIQADRPSQQEGLTTRMQERPMDIDRYAIEEGYLDMPLEIHARLNVMRYKFGISPCSPVTNEELDRVRQSIDAQTQERTPQELRTHRIDESLMNKYPRSEVKRYFNEVSQLERDHLLDQEHQQAHPDRAKHPDLRTAPSESQPLLAQHTQRGHRMV